MLWFLWLDILALALVVVTGLIEFWQVLCRGGLELRTARIATEFDFAAFVDDDDGFAHRTEWFISDDAGFERVGSNRLGGRSLSALAGTRDKLYDRNQYRGFNKDGFHIVAILLDFEYIHVK